MVCERCKNEFEQNGVGRKSKFCPECRSKHSRDILRGKVFDYSKPQTCEKCGNEYYRNRKTKYCPDCSTVVAIFMTREKRATGEYKDNRKIYNKQCAVCGRDFQTKRKRTKYCSISCSNKSNPGSRRRVFIIYDGEKRCQSWEYRNWRKQVYSRDNYMCQVCGDSRGGNLEAHHLESWDRNKDLRFDINNGITLCKKCHSSFHIAYGFGNNTREQFDEFLKERMRREVV